MCCSKGLIKRVLPFFLTFAVGLFIASFFMTVTAPSFQFPNRGERRRHQAHDRQMELEIQRLKEINYKLEQALSDRTDEAVADGLSVPLPPPPPAPVRNNAR